jgi:hypothetical protein
MQRTQRKQMNLGKRKSKRLFLFYPASTFVVSLCNLCGLCVKSERQAR